MAKEIYERTNYLMPDVDHIISQRIIEYDMKEAGWNLILYYNLLPEDDLKKLSKMNKAGRHVAIGIIRGKNRVFSRELSEAFANMRKLFLVSNNLKDSDVLSIKNDAIYIINKQCSIREFDNVEFVAKNKYTSFHKFGNIEFYYHSSRDILHIKGVDEEDLAKHEDYIVQFFKRSFKLLESSNKESLIKYLKKFILAYKRRELKLGYYRELSSYSCFTLQPNHNISDFYLIGLDEVDEDYRHKLNISYNYLIFILPFIQKFYF